MSLVPVIRRSTLRQEQGKFWGCLYVLPLFKTWLRVSIEQLWEESVVDECYKLASTLRINSLRYRELSEFIVTHMVIVVS